MNKKANKVTALIISLLLIIMSAGTVFSIKPLEDKKPQDLPEDAEVELAEKIEEYSPEAIKETHIKIERLHKSEAHTGDTAAIVLRVTNEDNEPLNITVIEKHRPGLVYPDEREIKMLHYESQTIPYYEWNFIIPAKSERLLKYNVKAESVGMTLFSPAYASDLYGNSFKSESTTIKFTCNPDGKCDPRENFIYCPDDCGTGSRDSICDGAPDGICDPDCESDADPDCKKEIACGDGICSAGENYDKCPNDCPSGGEDNYCDRMDDGICDPDCGPEDDPDCGEGGEGVEGGKEQKAGDEKVKEGQEGIPTHYIIIGAMAVIIILLLILLLMKRGR